MGCAFLTAIIGHVLEYSIVVKNFNIWICLFTQPIEVKIHAFNLQRVLSLCFCANLFQILPGQAFWSTVNFTTTAWVCRLKCRVLWPPEGRIGCQRWQLCSVNIGRTCPLSKEAYYSSFNLSDVCTYAFQYKRTFDLWGNYFICNSQFCLNLKFLHCRVLNLK